MADNDNDHGGIIDRIKETVEHVLHGDEHDASGADAVANVPTDVAGAAGNTVADSDAGSRGTGAEAEFGPAEGSLADVLPGGPGVGTDEDDMPSDRLSPNA